MKKTIIILLIATITSCSTHYPIEGIKFDGLKGKIESVKMTRYDGEEKFGEAILGDIVLMSIHYYNAIGDLTKQTVYNANGELSSELLIEYSDKNNAVQTNTFYYSYQENSTSKMIIEKGDDYIKRTYYDNDSLYYLITEDKQDKYHLIIRDQDDILIGDEYYDINNNLIEDKLYHKGGKLTTHNKYVFDEKGLLISHKETSFLFEDDGEVEESTFKYLDFDSHGNWTKRIIITKESDKALPQTYIEVLDINYR